MQLDETQIEQIHDWIIERNLRALRDFLVSLDPPDIAEVIDVLNEDDRVLVFRILPREIATDVFAELSGEVQEGLVHSLGDQRIAILLNEMSADDRTAFFEELPAAAVRKLLLLLPREERIVASSLLGYPEHSVGRHMNPDYVMVKENWTIAQALEHVRKYGQDSDSLNHIYVVDPTGKLLDDIRIREILLSLPDRLVAEIMDSKFVALEASQDQEAAVELFKKYARSVLPVIDSQGMMLGIVTIDDVLEIAEEEATEDIQKLGAVEALEDTYIRTSLLDLIKKRASWLVILFIGEMLTASAMSVFQSEIERAVILALFIPLIISSGGNAGSQASTLVIRALGIGEIKLTDWIRVFTRELRAGLALGGILGLIGFLRVASWHFVFDMYGPHWFLVGVTVCLSLIGVVLWGSVVGAMLPFGLKRIGADPATSSAPFVATLVDVTGLAIYFTVARVFLIDMLK